MSKRFGKKTTVNFRDKSFLSKIINGTDREPVIPFWDDLPEIDFGNDDKSYSDFMESYAQNLKPDIKEIMLFIWTAAPDKLKKAMAKYKVIISNEKDIDWLIRWNENGDFSAWIQTNGFTPVNLEDVIAKITFTNAELLHANSKINFGF